MAEEIKQEQTTESAPAAQVPLVAEQGENQQVQAQPTEPASEVQQEASPAATETEIEEWHGNDVDTLPKPLQARARGMLKKFHEVTQEAAAVKQKAQAYEEMVNHPEFQEFLKWQETRQTNPTLPPMESLSEDDFLAAQTDPRKFEEVQQRLLMKQAAPVLKALESVQKELTALKQEKAREQASRQLDAFSKEHPDFWQIEPSIMKASLEEVVQKNGGTVEEAYNHAKRAEKRLLERVDNSRKQQIDAKKKAVTAPPSVALEPEIIYAANRQEANRIAFEQAQLGKRVDVRIKK